ncbi:MAG: amino acid ABC transporter permease [Rickettsiaceae bacterium]|nr:amino acid ABC transporter permease [Rickettsiaceae bacterium]
MAFIDQWGADIIFIIAGILVNLKYTFISVFVGLLFATILAASKFSKNFFVKLLADSYTSVFRGTPLLIQLTIIYYVTPSITGLKLSVFFAACLSLSLNSAAYVSEIIRSGINSVDQGQFDAAKALGLNDNLILRDIILPQALKKIFPALVNELVNMLKETSIISIIGEMDILRRAQIVANQKYNYIIPLMTSAMTYYIIVLILVYIANRLEDKLN